MRIRDLFRFNSCQRMSREMEPYLNLWGATLRQSFEMAIEGNEYEIKWWEESPVLTWICDAIGMDSSELRKIVLYKIKKHSSNRNGNYLF